MSLRWFLNMISWKASSNLVVAIPGKTSHPKSSYAKAFQSDFYFWFWYVWGKHRTHIHFKTMISQQFSLVNPKEFVCASVLIAHLTLPWVWVSRCEVGHPPNILLVISPIFSFNATAIFLKLKSILDSSSVYVEGFQWPSTTLTQAILFFSFPLHAHPHILQQAILQTISGYFEPS